MTYIRPRVAIWGAFCPPLYTVYNNSRSRKELCTRVPVARYPAPPPPSFAVPRAVRLFPPPPPPSPLPFVLFVRPALSFAMSFALFRSSAVLLLSSSSRLMRARASSRASERASERVLPCLPPDVHRGFLRYRESFRARLRATDYRNQATSGSGISTANYNHRFSSRTSLPRFRSPLRTYADARQNAPRAYLPRLPPSRRR